MSAINTAASIRQKLLNQARERQVDFQQLLTRYGLERLLYRLSQSEEQKRFILKGAMLFELWFNLPHRPTRDLDFLTFGNPDGAEIVERFKQFLSLTLNLDDGIEFDISSIKATEIRKDAGYPGIRITLKARLDNALIPIQCDLGFGDAVTPGPLSSAFPTLLPMPAPQLLVYPQATVVAEKLEAMVKLDELNSRVKDYFDIWVLLRQPELLDSDVINAIAATFERRKTAIPRVLPSGLSAQFAQTRSLQWQQFIRRNRLQAPEFSEVVTELERRCWPLFQKAANLKQ
jgi:predicted nucleotidyltransferase component of viral defense system